MPKSKRKNTISPTQRSLRRLRDEGWTCEVVEHWNEYAQVRIDLFGFIDILAFRGEEILGVQATTRDNVAHRVNKIHSLPVARAWCQSWTRRLEVWGWGKIKAHSVNTNGVKISQMVMECRIVRFESKMFDDL